MAKRELPAPEWLAAAGQPRVVVVGGRAMVENHVAILEFREDAVRLATRRGVLAIEGAALVLKQARPGTLIVEGRLMRVSLPGLGEDT